MRPSRIRSHTHIQHTDHIPDHVTFIEIGRYRLLSISLCLPNTIQSVRATTTSSVDVYQLYTTTLTLGTDRYRTWCPHPSQLVSHRDGQPSLLLKHGEHVRPRTPTAPTLARNHGNIPTLAEGRQWTGTVGRHTYHRRAAGSFETPS